MEVVYLQVFTNKISSFLPKGLLQTICFLDAGTVAQWHSSKPCVPTHG